MRPARLLKVITSQLDVLEDMKNEFENLLANINNILQKGFKWIEDESNELSFMELNHLLANGTKECLTKCHVIAKNGSEEWSHPILSKQTEKTDVLLSTSCSSLHSQDDFQNIKEDISEIEKSQLEKFKLINRKLASLEKQTMETNFKDIDTKYSMKFEEIMKEFHSASDFMSHLQFQNESLVNLMKEKTAEINDIRQTLNDVKAQSVTHLCNLNPADTQTYNEVCEKLAGNTKLIEALQSHGESTSTKVNAMECNFENISTAVDSQKKCVAKLSDDTTEFKLSIEKMLKNLTEKTDALESKVTSVENKVEEMNNNIQSQFQSLSCDQVAVGFDVCVDDNLTPKFNLRKDTVLTCFNNKVIENIQDDCNRIFYSTM